MKSPAKNLRSNASSACPKGPVCLIHGEDDFTVSRRAKEIWQAWCAEIDGMDHETVDAAVGNSGEALKAISKLREALNTLPFFGTGKVVWFKNCTFLAEDRTSKAAAVTEELSALAEELKKFKWQGVRLLISAGKADKRRQLYKALESIGDVESYAALEESRDWAVRAEQAAEENAAAASKEFAPGAAAELVAMIGADLRQIFQEVEKLKSYTGTRTEITRADVAAVTTRNKHARAFALAESLGDRDLPRSLRCLDEELWEVRLDPQRSAIGLLFGLVSKVRTLLITRAMLDAGLLRPTESYQQFQLQLQRVPADALPSDRRLNPMQNPFGLFKALAQARRYSVAELALALERLLDANMTMITSRSETSRVLQQVLVSIIQGDGTRAAGKPRTAGV